ncbi:MARVEL domain-containing protein 3 [Pelodytes ibericus]
MGEPGIYHSDGESRAPRKQKSQQTSDQRATRDSSAKDYNGRSHNRERDQCHGDKTDMNAHRYQNRDQYSEDRMPERKHRDRRHNQHEKNEQYPKEREPNQHRQERSRDRYGERDRPHKERERDRDQDEKGSSRYAERDRPYKDRERDRDQDEKGSSRYAERDRPYKDRESRKEKELYRNQDERDRYPERDWHQGNYSDNGDKLHHHTMDRCDRYPPYEAERSYVANDYRMNEMEYYETDSDGGILNCHKCRYLCTGRACCQMVEVLLNMLILICCSVSYNSTGGFTGITNLGGIYYYQFGGAYSGFSGADGERAQALDVQFYQLKLPTVTASMAFGGALMGFCCLLVLIGVLRIPWRFPIWLLVESALDIAIAVGYIPALYFYFWNLHEAYNSQVCKDREGLYSSKGYQGFTCSLHGADIAAALFACMAVISFLLSAVLAVKGFRRVRQMKKEPKTTVDY